MMEADPVNHTTMDEDPATPNANDWKEGVTIPEPVEFPLEYSPPVPNPAVPLQYAPEPELSVTPATFKQLHVHLPTEEFREPARWHSGWSNGQHRPSDVWLDNHPQGFLLMHNLHRYQPFGRSMLLKSLDTGKLVVNKRFKRWAPNFGSEQPPKVLDSGKRENEVDYKWAFHTPTPPELRFARLDDPRVEVRLPHEPYFAELYAWGIPGGGGNNAVRENAIIKSNKFDRKKIDKFSLYFKRFNGRTLENLMTMYSDPETGGPVPEPFIWHVIEQLCRAVIFLQTGLTREDLEYEGAKPKDDWVPVYHRNIVAKNILLHFPEEGEEQDPLDCCFPRIVLDGFDCASLASDPPEWWNNKAPVNHHNTKTPIPPSDWEDRHMIGEIFRQLVVVHDVGRHDPDRGLNFNVDYRHPTHKYHPSNPELQKSLKPGEKPVYSDYLIDLLGYFELKSLAQNQTARFSDEQIRGSIIPIGVIIDDVLPMAESRMEEYRDRKLGLEYLISKDDNGMMADVRWVVPDDSFEMTPHCSNQGTEELMLAEFRNDFEWLYGPYIPAWYKYEDVVVTTIPAEAEHLLVPYTKRLERGTAPAPAKGGLAPQAIANGADSDDDDSESDGEDDDEPKTKAEGPVPPPTDEERPKHHDLSYITNIRQYQFEEHKNEKPQRVWEPKSPKVQRTPGPNPKTMTLKSLLAERLYLENMKDARKELERCVDDDREGRDLRVGDDWSGIKGRCGCSNCARRFNMWKFKKRDRYNDQLLAKHDQVQDEILHMEEHEGAVMPQFDPLMEDSQIPLTEPLNPWNVENGVELWDHNPFDDEYTGDWVPDKYYPWEKWDYEGKKESMEEPQPYPPSEDDDGDGDDPKPDLPSVGQNNKRKRSIDAGPSPPSNDNTPRKSARTSQAHKTPKAGPSTMPKKGSASQTTPGDPRLPDNDNDDDDNDPKPDAPAEKQGSSSKKRRASTGSPDAARPSKAPPTSKTQKSPTAAAGPSQQPANPPAAVPGAPPTIVMQPPPPIVPRPAANPPAGAPIAAPPVIVIQHPAPAVLQPPPPAVVAPPAARGGRGRGGRGRGGRGRGRGRGGRGRGAAAGRGGRGGATAGGAATAANPPATNPPPVALQPPPNPQGLRRSPRIAALPALRAQQRQEAEAREAERVQREKDAKAKRDAKKNAKTSSSPAKRGGRGGGRGGRGGRRGKA